MKLKYEIKDIPKMCIAYMSTKGVENLSKSYEVLLNWAHHQPSIDKESLLLTIFLNSFKDTLAKEVKMKACIKVSNVINTPKPIKFEEFTPKKCLVVKREISINEFEEAWKNLFEYLKKQNYTINQNPPFEIYYNNYEQHPKKLCIVDLCIPIN